MPRSSSHLIVAGAALLASLLLGGATKSGHLSDVMLQLVSVPLLLITLAKWKPAVPEAADRSGRTFGIMIFVLLVLLHLAQVVPLPLTVWAQLPGRELPLATYGLIGAAPSWRPISQTPNATVLAALSLLPITAVFLATLQLGHADRRLMCFGFVGFAALSAALGILQIASGPASWLRPYTVTNAEDAVGFFANRNHFSALLYCALLFALPIGEQSVAALTDRKAGQPVGALGIAALGVGLALLVLISGLLASRSRAGILLGGLAMAGGILVVFYLKVSRISRAVKLMIAGFFLVVLFVGQNTFSRIYERFTYDGLEEARYTFLSTTIEAARAHMPFGSGVGSFVQVYGAFEPPSRIFASYANRAHNDLAEAWLETGAAGLVLFALFMIWLILRVVHLLRLDRSRLATIDVMLMWCALIAAGLLVAHSGLDYPLRTGAMGAVMAFCCALLVAPPSPAEERSHRRDRTRIDQRQPVAPPVSAGAGAGARFPLPDSSTFPATTPWARTEGWDRPTPQLPTPPSSSAPDPGGGKTGWGDGVVWPAEWSDGANSTVTPGRKREHDDKS